MIKNTVECKNVISVVITFNIFNVILNLTNCEITEHIFFLTSVYIKQFSIIEVIQF